MATTLNYTTVDGVTSAVIQDCTNPAFTFRKTAVGVLDCTSHVTGHEATERFVDTDGANDAAKDAAALVLAKAWADEIIEYSGTPQEGTKVVS